MRQLFEDVHAHSYTKKIPQYNAVVCCTQWETVLQNVNQDYLQFFDATTFM